MRFSTTHDAAICAAKEGQLQPDTHLAEEMVGHGWLRRLNDGSYVTTPKGEKAATRAQPGNMHAAEV